MCVGLSGGICCPDREGPILDRLERFPSDNTGLVIKIEPLGKPAGQQLPDDIAVSGIGGQRDRVRDLQRSVGQLLAYDGHPLCDRIPHDAGDPQLVNFPLEVPRLDEEGGILRVDPAANDERSDNILDVVDDDARRGRIVESDPGNAFSVEEEGVELISVAELPGHMVPPMIGDVLPLDLVGPKFREQEVAGTKVLCRTGRGDETCGGQQSVLEIPDTTSAEVECEAETATSPHRKAKPLVISAADHRIGPPTLFLPARAGVTDPGLNGPFAGTGPQMQLVVVGWPHSQVSVISSTGKARRGSKPGS